MAGDIDEISQALGSIQADVSNVKEHVKDTRDFMAAINLKLGDMNTQYVLMAAKVDAAHARLDEEKRSRIAIEDDIKKNLTPKLDFHDLIIGRIIWVGSGMVTFITIALNYLPSLISRFL